jgi:hypothetical protein
MPWSQLTSDLTVLIPIVRFQVDFCLNRPWLLGPWLHSMSGLVSHWCRLLHATLCRSRVSSLSGTISEYRLKSGMSVGVLSLLPHLTNSGLFLSISIPLVYTPITEHEQMLSDLLLPCICLHFGGIGEWLLRSRCGWECWEFIWLTWYSVCHRPPFFFVFPTFNF